MELIDFGEVTKVGAEMDATIFDHSFRRPFRAMHGYTHRARYLDDLESLLACWGFMKCTHPEEVASSAHRHLDVKTFVKEKFLCYCEKRRYKKVCKQICEAQAAWKDKLADDTTNATLPFEAYKRLFAFFS